MPESLIRLLFDGPIDIVGDVHGEIELLHALVSRLGYDRAAEHPDGRRLIFVGDLTDRGPESVAVVEFVAAAVRTGLAQCVLGNHDLNILLGHRKKDNGWFFGHGESLSWERPAGLEEQKIARDFFGTLPLALVREDVRVVHAAWDDLSIELVRGHRDVVKLYELHRASIDRRCRDQNLGQVEAELAHQNENPVKRITSGPEEKVWEPVDVGGTRRNLERVPWWHDYGGDQPLCVFGHYSLDATVNRENQQACCVDFGAYKRRLAKSRSDHFKLAAFRLPERVLYFADGTATDWPQGNHVP